MTGYVKEALHQFGNNKTIKPQHQPYLAPERTYGADARKMKPFDTSLELPMERVKKIERKIEKFLYYARRVENWCLSH